MNACNTSLVRSTLLALTILLGACRPAPAAAPATLDDFASDYVRLALSFGALAPDELDFYFGPSSLQPAPGLMAADIASLTALVQARRDQLAHRDDLLDRIRTTRLLRRYDVLLQLMDSDTPGAFADRVEWMYGLQLNDPGLDLPSQALQSSLDDLLPGSGTLVQRLRQWQQALAIPPQQREAVFRRALAECRARADVHWGLPDVEDLILTFEGAPGAAWHTYLGNFRGSLALEPRALTQVSDVLDLACHEGYPGHQAQFLLAERAGLHVEDSVVLTRAPTSVRREGAAVLAAEMTFSGDERLAFERDVLFPLAGLPPEHAATSLRIHDLLQASQSAILPVIAEFLDGHLNFSEARLRLEREALVGSAPELLEYAQRHGTYVAGYTLEALQLRRTLEQAGPLEGEAAWQRLREILGDD